MKTDPLIDTWFACGKLHWNTIDNGCVTTKKVGNDPNPFVIPNGPRKPVFGLTIKKFVKCKEVTMETTQQAWGQIQCHKSLTVQEKNNVVFLCNSTQEQLFLQHCAPPKAFTSQVKKFVRCNQVTMPASQEAWGKHICQNKSLTSQEKHNVVYLCNPSQLNSYVQHCKVAPPLPVTTTVIPPKPEQEQPLWNPNNGWQPNGTMPRQLYICWNPAWGGEHYRENLSGWASIVANGAAACWTQNLAPGMNTGGVCGPGNNRLAIVRTEYVSITRVNNITPFPSCYPARNLNAPVKLRKPQQPLWNPKNNWQPNGTMPNQAYICWNYAWGQYKYRRQNIGWAGIVNSGAMACWTQNLPQGYVNSMLCGPGLNRLAVVRTSLVSLTRVNNIPLITGCYPQASVGKLVSGSKIYPE